MHDSHQATILEADKMFSQRIRDTLRYLSEHKSAVFCFGIAVALNWDLFAVWNMPLFCDEGNHLLKIEASRYGDFSIAPYLPMFPVYHTLMAAIMKVINARTLAQVRLITFLGSLCTLGAFYLIAGRLWPQDKLLRTAQFIFMPILFPFLPLIYTDVWALGFALLAVERSLAGRPSASAAAGFIATMLRTSNIIWALLAWLLLLYKEDAAQLPRFERIYHWLRRTWGFILFFSIFATFIIYNHGIVVGHTHNQAVTLNPSNVWFLLLLLFFHFIPSCALNAKRALQYANDHFYIMLTATLAITILFYSTYAIHHPYNSPGLWLYLRNRLLYWTTSYSFVRCVTLIPILAAGYALLFTPLALRYLRVLIPFALASVIFIPVIEQRYYLEAFAFFQAFRRLESFRWEVANLLCYIMFSFWLVHEIALQQLFL